MFVGRGDKGGVRREVVVERLESWVRRFRIFGVVTYGIYFGISVCFEGEVMENILGFWLRF